jgi:type IV secretory pathway TrbL component
LIHSRAENNSYPQSPLSPEVLMKNLPKVMSNMYGAAGGGMHGNSPTFKITMKKYEDMAIKVGDKVGIEVKKADSSSGV